FSFPAYFMIIAWVFMWVYHWSKRIKHSKLIYFGALFFLILPARLSIERMKIMDNRERNPEYIQEIESLRDLPKNTVVLDHPYAIQVMFYTDLTAYDYLPNPERINEIIDQGYDVVIHDKSSLKDKKE
ncbi:MAG: hypothetical protein ACPGWM_05245, partial [Flavobacteriales bacterium]